MGDKPEGPIWIDMSDALADLSVRKLILVANLALNKLSLRDLGEIGYHAGIDLDLSFGEKDAPHD